MSKTIKITVKCPRCASLSALSITEADIGSCKQGVCPKCYYKFNVSIPTSLASKFETDPTLGNTIEDISLLVETIGNRFTEYQTFELTTDYYSIGRKNNSGPASRPDIEVVTTDMKMSRRHAVIKKKGKSGFTIKDLGSKNGVFINGEKLDSDEEVYLNDGDTFRLGETVFRVAFTERSDDYDELTR